MLLSESNEYNNPLKDIMPTSSCAHFYLFNSIRNIRKIETF